MIILTRTDWTAVSNAPEKKEFNYKLANPLDEEPATNIPEYEEYMETIDAIWMLNHFLKEEELKVIEFEKTEPLPTYLYTINAGEFTTHEH